MISLIVENLNKIRATNRRVQFVITAKDQMKAEAKSGTN